MGSMIVAYDAAVTVAAVILFRETEGALADTYGRPAARRIVETAWAGGATPIVIVSPDPDAQVAAALAGSPAILAEPAPPDTGPVGQILRGIRLAAEHVTDTDAALVWPGRMVWADAETVTTLIETHGADRSAILRPVYAEQAGWPALVPVDLLPALAGLATDRLPDDLLDDLVAAGASLRQVDTGDPGTIHDLSTPVDSLPAFEGPLEPVGGSPEWGAAAAEMPDDAPLEGPSLAPYSQAAEEGD
jgi:CTP:molybdopterin cytidylyltransferase MocA